MKKLTTDKARLPARLLGGDQTQILNIQSFCMAGITSLRIITFSAQFSKKSYPEPA